MPADYDVLVEVYDAVQLGVIGERLMPPLIDFAQREGWMGRRTLDLGCGAGDSLVYLAQHGYIVTGIEHNTNVLALAKEKNAEKNLNVTWQDGDIRQLDISNAYDLVTAINVLTELESIRDVERVLSGVYNALKDGQWFIFDMLTIEGLYARMVPYQEVLSDDATLFLVSQNQYDYDKNVQTRQYTFFRKQDNHWEQKRANRVLRAYPVQALVALIKRSNFDVTHVLANDFTSYEPGKSQTNRVIIIAQKQ